METGERKNVYEVYNKIAHWFSENRSTGLMEKNYLDGMIVLIPDHGSVLDLGCGMGKPILEYLLRQNMQVTGVDASSAMLAIAQVNFPSTRFVLQDMRQLKLDQKFDAIVAWHSLFHLPAGDQAAMFPLFRQHLNPDGILLFTSGTTHGETWTKNGGEQLFLASLDTKEYENLLTEHHFQILTHVENDPHCGQANIWMAQFSPPVR